MQDSTGSRCGSSISGSRASPRRASAGRGAGLDRRPGRLRLRHRPRRPRHRRDRRGRGRGGARGRPDEFAAAPEALGEPARIEGLADPEAAHWKTESKVELAIATERAAREADGRVAAVETTVFVDERAAVALASSRGASGAYEATYCYAFLSAIAEDGDDRQTGLGFGMGRSPAALDPEGIGREAASADRAARRGEARLAHLPRGPRRDRRGELRRLHRRRPVRRRDPARALAVRRAARGGGRLAGAHAGRRRCRPGTQLGAVRRRGHAQGRTTLIERGELSAYLHDSYTARREGGDVRSTANAARSGYRSPPSVSTSNLIVATGELGFDELLAEAGTACTSPTSPGFTRASTRSRGRSRSAPPGARSPAASSRSRPTNSRSPRPALDAGRSPRNRLRGSLGPVRRLGGDPGAADRRDGDRRRLSAPAFRHERSRVDQRPISRAPRPWVKKLIDHRIITRAGSETRSGTRGGPQPGCPGNEAAEPESVDVRDRPCAADGRQVALVVIAERAEAPSPSRARTSFAA